MFVGHNIKWVTIVDRIVSYVRVIFITAKNRGLNHVFLYQRGADF